MKIMVSKYKLSASALTIFKDCPKCFWLTKNKWLKRPFGIFPSLPGGMDEKIKEYFDTYRATKTLPPELKDSGITGLFDDQEVLDNWRDWRSSNLVYKDPCGGELGGALDEAVVNKDGAIEPFDYKTKGSPLHYNPAKYYQTQLDIYALLLQGKDYKVGPNGYLCYYWPEKVEKNGAVKFAVTLYPTPVNPENAKKILREAVAVLKGKCPPPNPECEYCGFYTKRVKFDFKKKDVE